MRRPRADQAARGVNRIGSFETPRSNTFGA